MARQKNRAPLLVGATVAGLLGTLTSLLWSKRHARKWTEQANDLIENWRGERQIPHKNLFLGSLAGSVLGATTALLLAPKSGNELFETISETLTTIPERFQTTRKQPKKTRKATLRHQAAAYNVTQRATTTHKKARAPVKSTSKSTKTKQTRNR